MKDIRLPFILVLLIITLFAFCHSAHALTPSERSLVKGLEQINKNNEAKLKLNADTINKLSAEYRTLWDTADAQAKKLDDAAKLAGDQEFELGVQQKKIADQNAAVDRMEKQLATDQIEIKRWKTEAHNNASERDLFVWGFSFLFATAACYVLFPIINKVLNVTFPWTLAWVLAWLALTSVCYGIERFALRFLINRL